MSAESQLYQDVYSIGPEIVMVVVVVMMVLLVVVLPLNLVCRNVERVVAKNPVRHC